MDVLKSNTWSQWSSQPEHSADAQAVPADAKSTLQERVKKFLKIVNEC